MQNNFEPVNLKNAKRHLNWLIDKTAGNNSQQISSQQIISSQQTIEQQRTKISLWGKILNVLTKIF